MQALYSKMVMIFEKLEDIGSYISNIVRGIIVFLIVLPILIPMVITIIITGTLFRLRSKGEPDYVCCIGSHGYSHTDIVKIWFSTRAIQWISEQTDIEDTVYSDSTYGKFKVVEHNERLSIFLQNSFVFPQSGIERLYPLQDDIDKAYMKWLDEQIGKQLLEEQ